MKKLLSLLIILFSCSGSYKTKQVQHLHFLKEQKKSAKEYVISLFENYDIVILCERDHKEFTQYELFLEIVKDPYFIENAGHIYTEVGATNMDAEINTFLKSGWQDSLSARNKITSIFRDIDYSPYWHCYNYPWFLGELYKINQGLREDKKLMLHPSDIEFDWSKCKTPQEYKLFDSSISRGNSNRDSIMAQNIIKRYSRIQSGSGPRRKALVIMNYKHAFLKDHIFSGNITHNTGRYLSDKYKGKVASVYIMGLAIPKAGGLSVVKSGKWDHYFEVAEMTDVGFNLKDSPFGSEDFDVIPPDSVTRYLYKDMFTGLLFYRPIQEHKLITGWRGFVSDEFIPELRRRTNIFNEAMELGMSKEEIEAILLENNTEKTAHYNNIAKLRMEVDQWKK
jgi:hypothetical protein